MSEREVPKDDEHGGPLGRRVRKAWFNHLAPEKQDEIVRPAFNSEHPTNKDKRNARERFGY